MPSPDRPARLPAALHPARHPARRPTRGPARRRGPVRPALPGLTTALTRGLTTALVAVLVAATSAATAAPARATSRVLYASPGDDLTALLASLRAGDTLRLRPGTYDAGYVRPTPAPGTAAAPITVTADDPARRPLIRGLVKLFGADHWVLRGLRIQATVPGFEALYLGGGIGWRVEDGEFFGARQTGAYDNVAIADDLAGRPPRDFTFLGNCVHDAADTTRTNTDHNIYVLFRGDSARHGAIMRNVIFGHPNGEGIKLGVGGLAGTRGPWGVTVAFNTVVDGGRQILLTGDVRNNTIVGNVLTTSREPFHSDPRTTAIYVNAVSTRTNALQHNYVWAASMVRFDPANRLIDRGDDRLRPSPGYTGYGSCTGFRTTNAAAAPYGRYGTGRW